MVVLCADGVLCLRISMEDGKIVESGTYDELSREGTGFNRMIKSQLLGSI